MVLDMLLHNRMSIVRVIENSVVWKARFGIQELIAQVLEPSPPVVTNRTRGLDYAPHRFDSKAKPFARSCSLNDWRPLLGTAVTIMEDRGRSTIAAKLFLQFVDEEVGITQGMLADGGDELLALIRFSDDDMMDPCRLPRECIILKFCERVVTL